MDEEKLKEVFTSANPADPLYRAFVQVLQIAADGDKMAAILPNLTSEDRAYNCGRCAAVEDVISTIRSYDSKNNLTKEDQDPSSEQGLS